MQTKSDVFLYTRHFFLLTMKYTFVIGNLVLEGISKETFKIIQKRTCTFILSLGWKDWDGVGKGFCANSF